MRDTGLHHDESVPASYAVVDGTRPTPTIENERSYSSTGRLPEVRRTGVGQYFLTFPDIGRAYLFPADTVQVNAVGEQPRYCSQLGWNNATEAVGERTVGIACYDETGRLTDAQFALTYLRGS